MAAQVYVQNVVKGIEIERDSETYALPPPRSCAGLTRVRADPPSVASCRYAVSAARDRYTVTVVSVTGKTYLYNGSEVVRLK